MPNLDRRVDNADWMRSIQWDIFTVGNTKLIDSVEELFLGFDVSDDPDERMEFLKHFVQLPAFIPAPIKLKKEIQDDYGIRV